MPAASDFIQRVMSRVPRDPVRDYVFQHWSVPGQPTDEGFGLLPVPGADPERVLARVLDVDHYAGNIAHVAECRALPGAGSEPGRVRFYQRVKIPLLGSVHHVLQLERIGLQAGYEVAAWHMLEAETAALDVKTGMRSQYNNGAWLAAPGVLGYALSSAPRRDDVGLLKWKAMTAGADVAAVKVVRENIEGMARWASAA